MKRLFWIGIWAAAVGSMSQLIHAAKSWRAEMSVGFVVATLAWLVVFAAAMLMLALRTYAVERMRGNVVRKVTLFERWLERGADRADE